MEHIREQRLTGERALFQSRNLQIQDCVFEEGESPLKESRDLSIDHTSFRWKYPLWYCKNVEVSQSTLLETARSGMWYTNQISFRDSVIEAPKTFRRANQITLEHVTMPNAKESFWNCTDITLRHVQAKGDYFGMNSESISLEDVQITGNYCFDGAKHVEVHNSTLISKDAFWNCEDVTVYDSIIIGEYLGWNSKQITFINCTIESLQGLCYMDHVKLVNCKLIQTTQAFEYSIVDAEICSEIESVMNPKAGTIHARGIKQLILNDPQLNPAKTVIVTDEPLAQANPVVHCAVA